MTDNMNLVGGGLKCDNQSCDFVDISIAIEDYDKWLNAPCPKCGANLLTQEDLDAVKMIIVLSKLVQASEYENKGIDGEATLHFNFDGTGNVEMSIEQIK